MKILSKAFDWVTGGTGRLTLLQKQASLGTIYPFVTGLIIVARYDMGWALVFAHVGFGLSWVQTKCYLTTSYLDGYTDGAGGKIDWLQVPKALKRVTAGEAP